MHDYPLAEKMSSSKIMTNTFGFFFSYKAFKYLHGFTTYTTITFVPLAVFSSVNSSKSNKHINGYSENFW